MPSKDCPAGHVPKGSVISLEIGTEYRSWVGKFYSYNQMTALNQVALRVCLIPCRGIVGPMDFEPPFEHLSRAQ